LTVSDSFPDRPPRFTQLLNVFIDEQTVDCTSPKIQVTLPALGNLGYHEGHFRIRGCYIECGSHDLDAAIRIGGITASEGGGDPGGGYVEIRDTKIVSISTNRDTQPRSAIELVSFGGKTYYPILFITDGLTLDGGTVGWSNYFAMDLRDPNAGGAWCFLWLEDVALLNGSDCHMGVCAGYINPHPSAGGGRIDWEYALQ